MSKILVRVYLEMTLQMEDTSSSAMPMIRMASMVRPNSSASSVPGIVVLP